MYEVPERRIELRVRWRRAACRRRVRRGSAAAFATASSLVMPVPALHQHHHQNWFQYPLLVPATHVYCWTLVPYRLFRLHHHLVAAASAMETRYAGGAFAAFAVPMGGVGGCFRETPPPRRRFCCGNLKN
ncbi:Hypothetical protein NTJ_04581 [Nesidiocoris tenuis]|nr:Hypothetical protein NTJ_04581 [Nesidiocoris tenuis]